MGKTEWMIAVLAAGLAAGVVWIRHRRQTGRDSYLPLWRPFVWLAGWLALILGIIGIFLPGLPTVPFVLLAAGCWSRTSPRFHRWLSEHRHFGPMVRNWEHKRAIPLKGTVLSALMMACSWVWMLYRFPERWGAGVGMAVVCLSVAVWMWRLPNE